MQLLKDDLLQVRTNIQVSITEKVKDELCTTLNDAYMQVK